ncbi:MAG TPA: TIGR03118 family protein [Casimicrobiaceae bacterium]|nr:TIGR03118 family protein [Casimicrobiaceae bacterium]
MTRINLLYAADFHNKKIDVFDTNFQPVATAGGFVDPAIPSSFVPFNIMNIGGTLYVAYAMKEVNGDDEVAGQGLGFVDAFDADGVLLARVASRGGLNAPWGMALASAGFGRFGGALLVGNFGAGAINAFDPVRGIPLGQLRDANNKVLKIDRLRGIAFGNGVLNQPTDALFFAAGPDGESQGLYGFLVPAPSQGQGNGQGD